MILQVILVLQYLLSKCASEINKSKDKRKLRRYHEIRRVLSQDPLAELIKKERIFCKY